MPVYLAMAQGSSNYKVDVSLKVELLDGTHRSKNFRAVLDTGAAPVIVRRGALPYDVDLGVLKQPPLLFDAQRKAISVLGVVTGHVKMGSGEYLVEALVAEELSVDLLLGTQFIDQHIQVINSRRRKVLMSEGDEVPLADDRNAKPGKVRVAECLVIPPRSEAVLPVYSDARGLCLVTSSGARRVSVTNGLHHLDEGENFLIKVANFSRQSVSLKPGMIIGTAETHVENKILNVEESGPSNNEVDWRKILDLDGLENDEKKEVTRVLDRYSYLWDNKRLGVLHGTRHRIDTHGSPVFQHPYRAGPSARQAEKEEVDRMLKLGVIEPSTAEWASPVVLIPKPDGSTRFCVDYRKLNALTARDVYPLPRMDECLDSLGEAEFFSTLDANSGFWQIEVTPEDRDKTTFSCHVGMYRFTRMPFGLINAPATFQRAMDIILSEVRWESVIVYLDDVIVFSRTFEEHLKHLGVVLGKLSEAGATLKFSKCHFFRRSVDYLGHRLLPHKLQVLEKNVEAIRKASAPTSKTQVRSFLGLCGVYRRFVPNYATIAKPLTALTKKGSAETFSLTPDQYDAFEALKSSLTSPPTLSLPREGRPYAIETDASDSQIGCVLQQSDENGIWHPLGYWSRQLNAAEHNYSATEKEALAIVWAVTHLRPYVERTHFIVRTDHSSLQWLLNISGDNARLVRWRLRLSEFTFDIQYKPGRLNQAADALSRMATEGSDQSSLDHDVPCLSIEVLPIVKKSIAIPEAGPTLAEVSLEPMRVSEIVAAQADDEMCKALLPKNLFEVDDRGLVCRTSPLDGSVQIVMPTDLQERCLSLYHLPKIAGHPGGTKMYAQMRKSFYWPRMAMDVNRYVASCPSCIKKSLRVSRKTTKLQLFPPTAPMEFIAMDILGPLTLTDQGNRFLLVVTDRFSKLTRAYPLATTTAEVVAKTFFDGWVAAGYGIPQVLLTDNGTQFVAKFFQSFCRILGVKQVFTSAYHPSTNGQTERFNRTIVEFMGAYVAEHQRDWDELAAIATYSYNVKPHPATGFTPFELVTAVLQTSLLAQVVLTPKRPERSKAEIRNEFLGTVSRCTMLARENLSTQQDRYKRAHDAHVRARTSDLAVGDWAYVKTYVAPRELSKKLIFPAVGPFVVTRVGPDRKTFKVSTPDGEVTVSADRVRKCPFPADLPHDMLFATSTPEEEAPQVRDEEDDLSAWEEYVIDHLVSHRRDDAGTMHVRVRWFGYDPSADTWEPILHIPRELLRRYVKRRKLSQSEFGLRSLEGTEVTGVQSS